MNIDTKGLDRIEEELIKRADLIKQEEELKGNTKAEYKMYQKSAYESIGNYFNKLKSILDKQDIKEIMIETGLNIKYCYDKVHKFNGITDGYTSINFNKNYKYIEDSYDNELFRQTAINWDTIQAKIEQTIINQIANDNYKKTTNIDNYNYELKVYKQLSGIEKSDDYETENEQFDFDIDL